MRELFLSVLDNAIKFNHKGGMVTVDLRCQAEEVVIAIADNGPGIAPDILARIFDPFTQGDGSIDRRYDGIGIGLPIVQRYAQLHGGRVDIESELGHGTTVRILLPIERLVAVQAAVAGTGE